jgi:hypothetical protein
MLTALHLACWILALASFAWSLYLLRRYKVAAKEALTNYRVNCDDAETDLAVRSIVLPVLGNTLAYGDSYGVTPLEEIARELVELTQSQRLLHKQVEERADRAEAACEELRKSLMRGSAVGRWHRPDHKPSADEWYHHVLTAEGPLLLTDEQWQVARQRAAKLLG